MRKKLYLVKREVIATTLKAALKTQGHVYEIVLADEKLWPDQPKPKTGFNQKKNDNPN